jgi:hypothetical protein
MTAKHWQTLGMLLAAIGMLIAGLDHWADAVKPVFIAGVLTAAGTVLKAMYQGSPNEDK